MDGISFIFKRFFYSFLSGCIINFYAIIYYYAVKTYCIPPAFFDIIRSFIDKNSLFFVFIIFAIVISLIIEGICQIGIEEALTSFDDEYLYDKDKKGNIKELPTPKKFMDNNNKRKYKKYKKLECIFIRPAIYWECRRYTNGKRDKNPMKTFIDDSKERADSWHFFNGD
jgi:hypothetical protein